MRYGCDGNSGSVAESMGFHAMSPDSRLFIAENIKPKDPRSSTSDMDILMMPVSGCERTKTEFESLCMEVDFDWI